MIVAVMRVHKNKDYTVMSNYHLRDKELSLKAKGLLSFMLSLPPEWDYSVNGLTVLCKEGISAIRAILKELEDNKYLQRVRTRDEEGKFGYVYNIYEQPYIDTPHVEEPHTGFLYTDNRTQINTKEINTNKLNTKEINTNNIMHQSGISSTGSKEVKHKHEVGSKEVRHKYGMYDNVLLTDTQFEKLTTEFPTDWQERIDRMSEYMKSTGKVYKDHLATIRAWARKEKKQNPKSEYDWSFETL